MTFIRRMTCIHGHTHTQDLNETSRGICIHIGIRKIRHWLLAHCPSGIHHYPLDLWFTLPEGGSLCPYRLGRPVASDLSALAVLNFDAGCTLLLQQLGYLSQLFS